MEGKKGPRAELWDPPMFKCWEMKKKWLGGMASQKPNEESMSGREGQAAPTTANGPPEKRQSNALELSLVGLPTTCQDLFG